MTAIHSVPLQHRARLLFDAGALQYDFGPTHPLNPNRIRALMDLLQCSKLWNPDDPRTAIALTAPATDAQLCLIHSPAYVAAVRELSLPLAVGASEEVQRQRNELALRYGFGDSDTPPARGMHEASARIAGGTITALCAVIGLPEGGDFSEQERPLHVFHPHGGLHHAWAEHASGFCIYNDAAVAIAHVLQACEAKILYIDFDAHHGDGVQRAFYDDPRVMTISLHETGRYLFPGSGDVLEMGNGSGRGYSVNVPLEPYTEDDGYIEVMDSLLSQLVTAFAPDVIVSNHGCDTHAWDPLTHLSLTMRGINAQSKLAHQLAHTYCHGRWVALGGGGYSLYRVVPRAWGALWAELSEQTVPEHLPAAWVKHWRAVWLQEEADQDKMAQEVMGKSYGLSEFPTTFHDPAERFPPLPRRWEINYVNRQTTGLVRHLLIPSSIRQAFPFPRQRSPFSDLFDLLHLNRTSTPSRTRVLQTARGQILLRDFCPPSLIERLKPEAKLNAFARLPEREHKLMLDIAQSPDCSLTVAHTPAGEIVGQVTIAPADEWWEGIDNLYEVAIEVSANWRGLGIARELLAFALELDAKEDMIFFAIGLNWHWDAEGLGISMYKYRELIKHLFGTQKFTEYSTTEPNVSMEPTNVLVARVGERVDKYIADQFLNRLIRSTALTGGI